MIRLFVPDLAISHYSRLDIGALQARGIRLLLCDVDNTLSVKDETGCPKEAADFLIALKKAGIVPVLFTNNTRSHLERVFSGHPAADAATFCCKPLPFSILRTLKKHSVRRDQAAIVGDQLYTDMLAGHLAGITTILSLPLSDHERGDTKVMRMLEKPLYDVMERRGLLKRGKRDVRIL